MHTFPKWKTITDAFQSRRAASGPPVACNARIGWTQDVVRVTRSHTIEGGGIDVYAGFHGRKHMRHPRPVNASLRQLRIRGPVYGDASTRTGAAMPVSPRRMAGLVLPSTPCAIAEYRRNAGGCAARLRWHGSFFPTRWWMRRSSLHKAGRCRRPRRLSRICMSIGRPGVNRGQWAAVNGFMVGNALHCPATSIGGQHGSSERRADCNVSSCTGRRRPVSCESRVDGGAA